MVYRCALLVFPYGLWNYEFDSPLPQGLLVRLSFKKRWVLGVVWEEVKEDQGTLKLKKGEPAWLGTYEPDLCALGQWMAQYYKGSLGLALATMVSPGTWEKREPRWALKKGQDSSPEIKELFKNKRFVKEHLWRNHLPPSLWKAWEMAAQRVEAQPKTNLSSCSCRLPPSLTEEQKKALFIIEQNPISLLYGITGSGKTWIYVTLICKLWSEDPEAQVLWLLPEIGLSSRMAQRIREVFGDKLVSFHSGISPQERVKRLDLFKFGQAHLLIGPRSALFASFKNLKLIIVDEEHDSSYKQSSGLLYHARDVALVRGRQLGARVVLGSATPSLESYSHGLSGKYALATLKERPIGSSLPKVQTVYAQNGEIIPEVVYEELERTHSRGEQSLILLNRRGYAYYLYDPETKHIIPCPNCELGLTVHEKMSILRCHHCHHAKPISQILKNFPGARWQAIGTGVQKVESLIREKLPHLSIARLDGDTSIKEQQEILEAFHRKEKNILLGTQIITKGYDLPSLTNVVILEAQQGLLWPDFRAGEKTFQLLVQAAGRAGRGALPGKVWVVLKESPCFAIQTALAQNYEAFYEREIRLRERFGFPPKTHWALIRFFGAKKATILEKMKELEEWHEQKSWYKYPQIKILGPMPGQVEKLKGYWIYTLVASSQERKRLREYLKMLEPQLLQTKGILWKIDVDPYNLFP